MDGEVIIPLHVKQVMWKCLSCTLSTSPVHDSPHEKQVIAEHNKKRGRH